MSRDPGRAVVEETSGLPAYDLAVPGPPKDPEVAQRFADLRGIRGADPRRLDKVRDVVLVVSSSRSGSTLLAQLLRGCSELLHIPGEVNPYAAVARLDLTGPGNTFASELAAEIGSPSPLAEVDALVASTAWRLTAQWPSLPLDVGRVEAAVSRAMVGTGDWSVQGRARFTELLLRELSPEAARQWRRYDVPGAEPLRTPLGPPDPRLVVEMPPFRLLGPWRAATDSDLEARSLVLATPRNAFRIGWLERLFRRARVRVLHLVRNPAASVTGLVEGWRHPGFFNVTMPVALSVEGYTDPRLPWTREWWKFDVPPRWRDLTGARLAEVCVEQWASPHEAVLAEPAAVRDRLRVRFEDLVGSPERRERVARQLADWLGISDARPLVHQVVRGLPLQMATSGKGPGRWRRGHGEVRRAVRTDRVLALCEQLGYAPDPSSWE